MTTLLFRSDLAGTAFELAVVVVSGVTLASTIGWLVARRLACHAALRHFVLFAGLVCCLAMPAATSIRFALDGSLAASDVKSSPAVGQRPSGCCLAAEARPLESALSIEGTPMPLAPATAASQGQIVAFAVTAWAAGTLFLLGCLARNAFLVVRLRRSGLPLAIDRYQTLLSDVAEALHVETPLLLVTDRVASPMVVGFGRPAVIWPERLRGAMSDDEIRDVLFHELAHLKRRHQWSVVLQEIVRAIYWPVLPLHLLIRDLRRAAEEVCDNDVLVRRDPLSYGETLLHVGELTIRARRIAVAVGLVGGPGELERRVAGLLDPARNIAAAPPRTPAFAVAALFAAIAALPFSMRSANAAPAGEILANPPAAVVPADDRTEFEITVMCCPT